MCFRVLARLKKYFCIYIQGDLKRKNYPSSIKKTYHCIASLIKTKNTNLCPK